VAIPEEFLDRMRALVRISEVAGSRMKLRREGGCFRAVDNHSLTVDDKKKVWKDWATNEGGDVFKFLETYGGLSFIDAVKEVARRAGEEVPGLNGNGHHEARGHARTHEANGRGVQADFREGYRQAIPVATWDYVDAAGRALYQTVRLQWRTPAGDWEKDHKTGKIRKAFYQRRRTPDVDGCWINALSVLDGDGGAIPFMRKGPGADWRRYNEKNYRDWRWTERSAFEKIGNVEHTLLYLPEVMAELAEERQEQRPIFLPEGEKKVDLLRSWGLLATCNSGGAQNWHDGMACLLRDAADIVILEDNDDAGRNRTLKIAPSLLEQGCRVRSLALPAIWPDCPEKGDIVDWADAGGGRDALFRALGGLSDWRLPPYQSRFGAHTWGAHNALAGAHYEWLVKGLIPKGENVLIMGPSGSGKSFEATSLALHVARGVDYRANRVKRCGVVYLNYEAGGGMPNRLKAYQEHYRLNPKEFIPFTWITKPPGLYASADKATELSAEINELTKDWTGVNKLGVIVIDTHNAATRGSTEIKTEDITRIMDRYDKLKAGTGAAIWIVSHTNAAGNHRGNEVLYNAIDTCILVEKIPESSWGSGKDSFVTDDQGRVMRRLKLRKQREGADNLKWEFVLDKVRVGTDEDGEPITSMVSVSPAVSDTAEQKYQRSYSRLSSNERLILQVLTTAYEKHAVVPPAALDLPRAVVSVVRTQDFFACCDSQIPGVTVDERRKACNKLQGDRWISQRKIDGVGYMWRIREDRKPIVAAPQAPLIDEATGKPMEDL
jgi:hypothetical protein